MARVSIIKDAKEQNTILCLNKAKAEVNNKDTTILMISKIGEDNDMRSHEKIQNESRTSAIEGDNINLSSYLEDESQNLSTTSIVEGDDVETLAPDGD